MLLLPNSCFVHIPKTGGTWVKKAIIAAGIEAEEFAVNGNAHVRLYDCPRPDNFKFAFVRHPLSLYRSYWQYKLTVGWGEDYELDRLCKSEDFEEFVRRVLEHYPGIYSRSLEEFVGSPGEEIDFIGRFENLVEDLISALAQAGESFDAAAIRRLPPANVSDKEKAPAEFSADLENAVREAERSAFLRFGYQ